MGGEDSCYGIVAGEDIEQGDLLRNCPLFVPDYPSDLLEQISDAKIGQYYEISGEWQMYNVVIMSQSCDLENGKLKFVVVCPYWSLTELSNLGSDFRSAKTLEDIRRGNRPSYHMLDKCDLNDMLQEQQVVDFRSVYSVPYSFLKQLAHDQGKRLRLLSPYKEDLSQAFGKFFMRIARPKGIDSFRK